MTDLLMTVFTGLLFVVGVGQLYMFIRQLRAMQATVEDSKGIAESARRSADAALQASQATMTSERAYVTMSARSPGLQIESVAEKGIAVLLVNMRIKNFGRTPARITDICMNLKTILKNDSVPKSPNYSVKRSAPAQHAFLVAGDEVTLGRSFVENIDAIAEAKKGAQRLLLYGFVDYVDQFGCRHRYGYGREYHPAADERLDYASDEQFRERENLMFISATGYNYDRIRGTNEGNDWD